MKLEKVPYGKTPEGTPVDLYTLTNDKGLEAKIITYGGIIVSLKVPDRDNRLEDIVLGCDSFDEYLKGTPYFGCITGRICNRIAGAKFLLEGKEYRLPVNDGENSLHGGCKGFDKVVWQAREVKSKDSVGVELTYISRDGEEGFPGNLTVTVAYSLTSQNELKIDYSAETDKTTVLNLTNHTYFNLHGAQSDRDILNHVIMINAGRFTPINIKLIPTGELRKVQGTPLDFLSPAVIGERINDADAQLKFGGGYDHNWVLDKGKGGLTLAARLYEPDSGRVMETYTTEPAIQLYTGNFLDGTVSGKGGKTYPKRFALCLETQHFPDSPNQPKFPSTVLKPGERFASTTVYKFAAQ